jgi:hypothetical protein
VLAPQRRAQRVYPAAIFPKPVDSDDSITKRG